MEASVVWGSLCFGAVVGWITYYTMRRNTKPRALSDLTVIVAVLVGPAILTVFPVTLAGARQTMFGYYGIGLAFGFFAYYILFVVLAWAAPLEVLLSMGLVQECEVGGDEEMVETGTPVRRRDGVTTDQGNDHTFIEVR